MKSKIQPSLMYTSEEVPGLVAAHGSELDAVRIAYISGIEVIAIIR